MVLVTIELDKSTFNSPKSNPNIKLKDKTIGDGMIAHVAHSAYWRFKRDKDTIAIVIGNNYTYNVENMKEYEIIEKFKGIDIKKRNNKS